jgi:hypothetical protein
MATSRYSRADSLVEGRQKVRVREAVIQKARTACHHSAAARTQVSLPRTAWAASAAAKAGGVTAIIVAAQRALPRGGLIVHFITDNYKIIN